MSEYRVAIDRRFLIHPADLTRLVTSGLLATEPKRSEVPRYGWRCQLCSEDGHIGECDPAAIERADARLACLFETSNLAPKKRHVGLGPVMP